MSPEGAPDAVYAGAESAGDDGHDASPSDPITEAARPGDSTVGAPPERAGTEGSGVGDSTLGAPPEGPVMDASGKDDSGLGAPSEGPAAEAPGAVADGDAPREPPPSRWPFTPPAAEPADPAPSAARSTPYPEATPSPELPLASSEVAATTPGGPATPTVGAPFARFFSYYGAGLCGEPRTGVVEIEGRPSQVFENLILTEVAPGVVRPRAIGTVAYEALRPAAPLAAPGTPPPVLDLVGQLPRHPTRRYDTRPLARIRYLVIHHTGAAATLSPADIATEHVEANGWPGIGYHYLVSATGQIMRLADLTTETYHVRQFNPVSVGIALAGDYASDVPSPAQLEGAAAILEQLLDDLGLPPEAIRGHREMLPTPCPGDTFLTLWKPRLLRMVEARRSPVPATMP